MKIPEVLLIEINRTPGSLAKVLQVIGEDDLVVQDLQAVQRSQDKTVWEITLEVEDTSNRELFNRINALPNASLKGHSDRVFTKHEGGKIEMISKHAFDSLQALRDTYTPGVARICLHIRDNPESVNQYTNLPNTVAIVTNGTAVLGLGNIGAVAGLPVMEGKAALFHATVGLSGIPILIESEDPDEIIRAVEKIAPSFGAIQLEDIAAPACFKIEDELRRRLNIPVLHDDQHGTAVVALAALINATKIAGKDLKSCRIGQVGLGAAGLGISRLLLSYGVRNVLGADVHADALRRLEAMGGEASTLEHVMEHADVVIATTGVKGLIKPEFVREGQVILALTNPDPEIEPDIALACGASFAADGRSVNNVLGFPGIFKGALQAGVKSFSDEMLIAASKAIAVNADADQLVPDPLNKEVHFEVTTAVANACAISPTHNLVSVLH